MSSRTPRNPQRAVRLSIALVILASGMAQAAATVGRAPDLAPHDPAMAGTGQAGDWHAPSVNVTNLGNASAGPVEVAFSIDGRFHDRVVLNFTLHPGESVRVKARPWLADPGNHSLEIKVDPDNRIGESDETNNFAALRFSIHPAPRPLFDLHARSLAWEANHAAGGPGWLVGRVTNLGPDFAPAAMAAFHLDGRFHSEHPLPSLPPGATAELSVGPIEAGPGPHRAEMVVDPADHLAETDETNNAVRLEFEVPPPPLADLSIAILGIRHERLVTEAGALPHPYPRHHIDLRMCNAGPNEVLADVQLSASAQARPTGGWTGDGIGGFWAPLAARECRERTYTWEPLQALGDVTVSAEIRPAKWCLGWGCPPPVADPDWSNNRDARQDFVLVGGLGGIVLPLP